MIPQDNCTIDMERPPLLNISKGNFQQFDFFNQQTIAFSLNANDALPLSAHPMDFCKALSLKLENVLDVPRNTNIRSEVSKIIILVDTAGFGVLDDRITLHEMLYRKRRHASQTGNIYLSVDKILG